MSTQMLDLLIPLRRKSRDLEEENEQLKSFLSTVPVEYCGWDQSGAMAVSAGLPFMLGVEKIETAVDVEVALVPGDAAALSGAFQRLQKFGENFEVNVNTINSKKTLKIFGKRGVMGEGASVFSVLWLYDITDFAHAAVSSMEAVTSVEKRKQQFASALNALPFPVWMRNDDLDIVWCNKKYSRMAGETLASVIADQKELPVTGAGKVPLNVRVMAQKAAASQSAQAERGHGIVDGKRRLLEVQELPLQGGVKSVGMALDVTAEEEWETSYKRIVKSYHEAMEQLRTAIAMFDADTRLEFYNSAYEQLTGMSGSWLNQKPRITEIIDKLRELRKLPEQADYRQYKQQWSERFTSLLEPQEDTQYLPDGSVVRMICVPRPMGGLMLTMEDVTSHLQLETSYNTLMAVQQETMNNLAEGIAVFGEDGRLRLSNHAFGQIWGMMPEALADSPHVSQMVESMRRAFEGGKNTEAHEVLLKNALHRDARKGRFTKKDGRIIEYSVVPLPDGNILNAYVDVTDTVKVEQALQEKNAALEEAERLKTDFIANVSYQLRTPLNAIMGFGEMLDQEYMGKLNAGQKEYTQNILDAGRRLTSLINDILDLASLEAGRLELHRAVVPVKTLMENVVSLTQEWGRQQRVEISLRCEDDTLSVYVDEARIRQVLLNLVSNAFNYSNPGGRVLVFARRQNSTVILGVKDNGVGIPAKDLERIFTPFDRIHSGTTEQRRGAGLGLTLVKSIVELHGGRVSVKSEEGKGTVAAFALSAE